MTYPARDLGIHPRAFKSFWIEADDESNTWMTSKICVVAWFEPHHLDFAHHIAENDGVLVFIYQRADEKKVWRALEDRFNGSKPLCFTVGLYCVFVGIHSLCQSRAEPRFEIWSGRNLLWSHDRYISPISLVHEIEICWMQHLQRIKRKIPECLDYSFSLSEGIKRAREKKKLCMVYLQGPTRFSWKVNRGSVVWLNQSGLFNDANVDVIREWCIFVHLAEDTVEGALYLTLWDNYTVQNDLPTSEKQKPIIALLDHNEGDFLWYSFDKEICKQADVEEYTKWFQGVSSKMVGDVYRPICCSEEPIASSRFRAIRREKCLLFYVSGTHCACNAIEKSLFQDVKVRDYLNRYADIRKIVVGSNHFLELLEKLNYEDISAPALFIFEKGFLHQFPLRLSKLRLMAECDFLNAFTKNLSMTNDPTQRMVNKTSESYHVDHEIKIAPKKRFVEQIWKTRENHPRFSKFSQHPKSFGGHFMQVEARPTWMTERVELVKDKAGLKKAVGLARNKQLLLLVYYRGNDEGSKLLEANCNKSRPLCYTVGLCCHYVMAEDVVGFETDGPRFEIWGDGQLLWSWNGCINSLSLVSAIENSWMELLKRTKGKLPEDWNVNFSMSEGMDNAKKQDKLCLVYYEGQPGLSLKQNKGSVISMKRHRLDKDGKLADMILKYCIFIHIVKETLSGHSYKIMWDNHRIKEGINSEETPIMAILRSDGQFLWHTWVNSKEMRAKAAIYIQCLQQTICTQVLHVDNYVAFDGSLVEASARAKEENKLVVAFLSGGDSVSSVIEKKLWEDKQVSEYFRNQVIYMRLISGSEGLQYADIAAPCILCFDNGEISHELPLRIIELKEAIKVLKDEPCKDKQLDVEVVNANQSTKKGMSKVNIIRKNDSMGACKEKPEHNKSPKESRCAPTEKYNLQFPIEMQSYILGAYDVKADGNCGFRVVAAAMGFGEKSWLKVRKDLLKELNRKPDFYASLFGETQFKNVQQALTFDSGNAPLKYWMRFPEMGHLIATYYGVVVIILSAKQCLTFLPLMENEIGHLLNTTPIEIGIGQVNGNHFVHLKLRRGHPLPNLVPDWERNADVKVQYLFSMYQDRLSQYKKCRPATLVPEFITLDE